MKPYQYFCPLCGDEEEPNLPPSSTICGNCFVPMQKRLLSDLEKSDETARRRVLSQLDRIETNPLTSGIEEELPDE